MSPPKREENQRNTTMTESGIDGDAPLDYATIQILPSQNRYEAYTCQDNRVEKLVVGVLEKLLPHLPGVNNLYTKGLNANFKLQPPKNLKTANWFTKSTLSRFLHIVGSTDIVDTGKVLEGEMSQLEEARKFHLSLYSQGHKDHFESRETDTGNSANIVLTSKSEVQNSPSDTSKNELLRAMDSRITALRSELVATFNQAIGETCSYIEIIHLAKFSDHFGANDLRNLLCMFIELTQQSEVTNALGDEKSFSTCASMNDSITKTEGNNQISKPASSETPVKYGVSPAKVAQVERLSSTESEEYSDSSVENQTSTVRSRSLIRSASPRRSASPMRRVQIGKSGSRRAAALTIKSLGYIPAREKILSHREVATDDSEEEGSRKSKKTENDVRRMSVQDAINLFESKQRDQITDVPQKNSLSNISLGATKSVLRRWSSGMGEKSSHCLASEDPVSEPPDNFIDSDMTRKSAEVNLESSIRAGRKNINEIDDVKLGRLEERACSPDDMQGVTDKTQEGETNERSKGSVGWSQRKEVELNQMFKKMMENKSVRKPQTNVRPNFPPEQRGGLYAHYKEKRDQKLRENTGKRAEKEAKFRVMQKILDERKAEMVSSNVNNSCKKDTPITSQKLKKNRQKLPSPQSANAKKEITKTSTEKKVPSRTSPLPATRKSWPSTPSPRAIGTSATKASGGIPSASTAQIRLKTQSVQSLPRPSPKVESFQQQRRYAKAIHNDKQGLVGKNEKQEKKMIKSSKTTTTKAAAAPGDSSNMSPAKPSLYNKLPKKSSVVPLETKPYLRKGLGFRSTIGQANKLKSPCQLEDSPKFTVNSIGIQEDDVIVNASVTVNEHQERGVLSLGHFDETIPLETQVNSHQKSEMVDNFDKLASDANDGLNTTTGSSKYEEEPTISPTAWVEIEEHQDQCDDSTCKLMSSANITPIESASPHVRQSLSQMLQEESSEADITEWGNTENPPAMIYQKDAPKGLKRLLKFARKSKGDANITGWSSPSFFSEGEDDNEESKSISKRNADNVLRKAALQANNYGQRKALLVDGYEGQLDTPELSSDESGISTFDAHKLHKGNVSTAASTVKGTRSFFSLSAFRGSKTSETKLH